MMRGLRAIVWAILPCRHTDLDGHSLMYRERRRLRDGRADVQHLVCTRCGHARPAMDRSPKEHARVIRIGRSASERLRVWPTTPDAAVDPPAAVVDIRTRQGSRG